MDFFPCFLDIDKHMPTVAFGYSNVEASKYEIEEYFKTTKLAKIFDGNKLIQLVDDYIEYLYFIKRLLKWSKWYIYDKNPTTRPYDRETDEEMIAKWNKSVIQLFEKYRISASYYERVLYAQLLNDHLWNPKFDPMNPRIQEYNKERLAAAFQRRNPLLESTTINDYLIYDGDSFKLMNLKLESDIVGIVSRSSDKLDQLAESGDIEGIKLEAAKLQFINILIEAATTFSDTKPDKTSFSLRGTIRKELHKLINKSVDVMKLVELKESDFNVNTFYQSTAFYTASITEYRQLQNYKEFIKSSL